MAGLTLFASFPAGGRERQKSILGDERFNILEVHRTSRNLMKQLQQQQHNLVNDDEAEATSSHLQ